jgi:hypothetical protein
MGRVLSPGIKRPGMNLSPPSSAEVEKARSSNRSSIIGSSSSINSSSSSNNITNSSSADNCTNIVTCFSD